MAENVETPVIVNLPTQLTLPGTTLDLQVPVRVVVTVLSLALAILNGLLNFKKYGELWLQYRMTEELLKHEKFLFLARAGKYGGEKAFDRLVQTIESLISAERNKFRELVLESRRPAAEQEAPPE